MTACLACGDHERLLCPRCETARNRCRDCGESMLVVGTDGRCLDCIIDDLEDGGHARPCEACGATLRMSAERCWYCGEAVRSALVAGGEGV